VAPEIERPANLCGRGRAQDRGNSEQDFHPPISTLDAGPLEAALRCGAKVCLGCGDMERPYGLDELLLIAADYFPA
jgi:hypothetical protein